MLLDRNSTLMFCLTLWQTTVAPGALPITSFARNGRSGNDRLHFEFDPFVGVGFLVSRMAAFEMVQSTDERQ